MSLTESIVEDAALDWFGELGYAVGHGAAFAGLWRAKPSLAPGEYARGTLIPAFSQREKGKREAVRWLIAAITEEARAMIRQFRRVRIERRTDP